MLNRNHRLVIADGGMPILFFTALDVQLSFPVQLCVAASPITQTHITGAVQMFLKK